MVSPIDGRLIAHGYDVDDRVIAISPRHGTLHLLQVLDAIFLQGLFTVNAAPGAARIVDLSTNVGA